MKAKYAEAGSGSGSGSQSGSSDEEAVPRERVDAASEAAARRGSSAVASSPEWDSDSSDQEDSQLTYATFLSSIDFWCNKFFKNVVQHDHVQKLNGPIRI